MVHAAEAVGIHDLADGEFEPNDTTLEQGINRQLNYLLDEVGCTSQDFVCLKSVAAMDDFWKPHNSEERSLWA